MSNTPQPSLPQPQPQDPQKLAQFMQLLQRLGPDALGVKGQQQPQAAPQQQQAPEAPQMIPTPVPASLHTSFDPTSTIGSLPQPVTTPMSQHNEGSSGSAEILSKLDPKGAMQYQTVQGVADFLHSASQKKEETQKTEAANAANALMSALEGAKTTGDFSPAEHIFQNNEALFNKVYKGWLQKSEEAKKPKKVEKADPEVDGFHAGITAYMNKGQQAQGAPQPPSSLQGKSGAKYLMPQAGPEQALKQQTVSAESQAAKQDPNRALGSQMTSDEQRQAELGKAGLTMTPRMQVEMQGFAVDFAKADAAMKESANKLTESQSNLKRAQTLGDTAQSVAVENLKKAEIQNRTALVNLDIARARGQAAMAKAKNGGTIPPGYRMRWQATTKAEDIIQKAVDRGGDFTDEEKTSLGGLLASAGAPSLAKLVPKPGKMGAVQNFLGMASKPADLLEGITNYKGSLKKALSGSPDWLGDDTTSSDEADPPDDSTDESDPLGLNK